MTGAAFDTLKFVRAQREKPKLDNEQAEGFAEAIAEAVQSDLATKADIAGVRADVEALRVSTRADVEALRISTKADLRELELRLLVKIEETKADTLRWVFGMIGFQTLVIFGAVIALARSVRP